MLKLKNIEKLNFVQHGTHKGAQNVQDLLRYYESIMHKHHHPTRYCTSTAGSTERHRLPCASSNQSLPVVAAAVDVDVSHDAIAAVAGESLLTVALLGRRLVSLHCQVVVGQPQLPVRRLWIQLERLTLKTRCQDVPNVHWDLLGTTCHFFFENHTVGLEFPWFAAAVPRLVNGLDDEDVLGATLEAVHGVMVLLDIGHNHPTVGRVAQTWPPPWKRDKKKIRYVTEKYSADREPHSAILIKNRRRFSQTERDVPVRRTH